jgi:hypothetical protein
VFGLLTSGVAADSSVSRHTLSFSANLGERITTLPDVSSSVIVGVNSD